MNKIFIVGIGPGDGNDLTPRAERALADADLIVGYTVYINLLGEKFGKKETASTPMRGEKERCLICFTQARRLRKPHRRGAQGQEGRPCMRGRRGDIRTRIADVRAFKGFSRRGA